MRLYVVRVVHHYQGKEVGKYDEIELRVHTNKELAEQDMENFMTDDVSCSWQVAVDVTKLGDLL
jgi:hypothetical protein